MKKISGQLGQNGEVTRLLHRPYRAVYGFGEKFDSVDQKGKLVRACVREKCFQQGEYAYCSMPFFMTPDGFGIYVDTYVEVDFDFRKEGEIGISYPVGSKGEIADIWLLEGSMKEILFQFRSLTGFPRVFPKWALGAWMSSNRWSTQDELEEQRALTKKHGFPHNVMVVEPWSDLTTHALFKGSTAKVREDMKYPLSEISFSQPWSDPKQLIDRLHADGLHLLLWIVPIYAQQGCMESEYNVQLCLNEGERVKARKECVLNADGTPYYIPHTWCVGSMVPDFTSESAREHWFNRFHYLKELGIDGFKTDGGEFIHDKTVKFSDGTTGLEGQNRYCEDYTAAFAQFMQEQGIVFSRAGGQRSPAFAVLWAGDQESTWQEFRSILKAGLSAGLSGFSLWGFDIAGFSGYLPSKELYSRAMQTAAFVPVMQWHSDPVSNGRCDFTGAWTNNDRSPWNIAAFHKDERLLNTVRKQFYLHYNLLPYFYNLMLESSRTGVPVLRHLALEFPEDERAQGVEDEFLLGASLLVAPVTEDYISKRNVYLPAGSWYELYSGEKTEGGRILEVELKEDRLPVFLRENGCLPLNLKGGKLCSDVGNTMDGYEELTFLISGEGRYTFEDDLGNLIELQWNQTDVTVRRNESKIKLRVLRIGKDKIYDEEDAI